MFVAAERAVEALELPGLTLAAAGRGGAATAKFDLRPGAARRRRRRLARRAGVQHRPVRRATTAARWLAHLARLLEALAAGRRTRALGRTCRCSPRRERQQAAGRVERHASGVPAAATCVHALFEAQAARTPDAVALVSGDETLTYARAGRAGEPAGARTCGGWAWARRRAWASALERSPGAGRRPAGRAQGGRRLRAAGPGLPGGAAGLHAGGRGAPVLLVARRASPRRWRTRGAATRGAAGLDARTAGARRGARRRAPAAAMPRATWPTSSTPRARRAGPRAWWCRTAPSPATLQAAGDAASGSTPGTGCSSMASLSASTCSVFELLARRCSGGDRSWCWLATRCARRRRSCGRAARRSSSPRLSCRAALLQPGDGARGRGERVALRDRSLVGGERGAAASCWQALGERSAAARLVNVYGPTESDRRSATCSPVPAGGAGDRRRPDRPADRQRRGLYVLDARLQPVPLGVPGELLHRRRRRGARLPGRPELTAETFVPDPFGEPGARLYRTRRPGAAGCRTASLEFLGRVDHQVKIRGFRIELGEIEAALAAASGGARGAWCWRARTRRGDAAAGGLRRAGGAAAGPWTAELRSFLRGSAAEYMVPVGVRGPGRPAADRQRQGGPARPCRRRSAAAEDGGELRAAAHAGRGGAGGDLGRGAAASSGSGVRRRLLRAGRPLAAGHAGGLARARRCSASSCRCARCSRRPPSRRSRARSRRCAPARGCRAPPLGAGAARRARCRSPSPSSGSGSSTSSSRAARSTTCPCALRLDGRAATSAALARAPAASSCGATRRCAPPSPTVDGAPVQVIAPAAAGARCRWSTSAGLPTAAREALARRAGAAEARRPFDLARGPLLRARLLRLGRRRARAAARRCTTSSRDGWSLGVLVARAGGALRGVRRGAAARRCPSCRPVRRLRGLAARAGSRARCWSAQLAYWRQRLAGAPRCWSCPPTGRGPRCGPAAAHVAGGAAAASLAAALRGARPARGGDAVHDPAGRLPGAAGALHRAGRRRGRHADRRPQPAGDRGADRLLRQHPGAARRLSRRPGRSASCCGGCARRRSGRLRAPGPAVRAAGGGAAAGAQRSATRRSSR